MINETLMYLVNNTISCSVGIDQTIIRGFALIGFISITISLFGAMFTNVFIKNCLRYRCD